MDGRVIEGLGQAGWFHTLFFFSFSNGIMAVTTTVWNAFYFSANGVMRITFSRQNKTILQIVVVFRCFHTNGRDDRMCRSFTIFKHYGQSICMYTR